MSYTTSSSVTYFVRVLPDKHELEIEMILTGAIAMGRIRLETPVWVPGDYSFAPYARDLFELQAQQIDTHQSLTVTRDGWQAFFIEQGNGAVSVKYTAYAYATEFGEPSGILDSEYAVLLGTRYLYAPAHLGACRVSYALPDAWKKIHHPAGATRIDETTWEYPSYEILLDTPVVMGHFNLYNRTVHGTEFYHVFVDQGVGFAAEVESFVEKLARIAEVFYTIFGSFPFENYTFVLTLNPAADWGLEHLTSTMCGLGPDVFTVEDETAHGVRVCAHELFHAWNVRRLRPSPLKKLEEQLASGSFTEGLWVAEGFTRYYEFLACTRVGVYSVEQFFSSVVGYYQHLTVQPAYERISGVDSSLATYLNHSKYSGRVNNSIDYYDKGMLIAFEADSVLRIEVPNYSLDRAFAEFYRAYVDGGPEYTGYTTHDVIQFFEKIHHGLGKMLADGAEHPAGLSVPVQLERLGFRLDWQEELYLGLVFKDDLGPTIYNVLDTSPAGQSGIAPEDVLTGVNGYAFSSQALQWAATHSAAVTLQVLRGHRMLSFSITPAKRQKIQTLIWEGDKAQAERIATWLGRKDFNPGKGQIFKLDFYENFHGIEAVL